MNHVGPTSLTTTLLTGRYSKLAMGLGVIVLLLVLPGIGPMIGASPAYVVQVLSSAIIAGVLVLSLNLAMGYGGMISMGHTALLAVGGYTTGILAARLEISPWIGIGAGILITAVVGGLLTAISLRASDMYFGLITLSFSMLIVAIAQQWEGATGGFGGLILENRMGIGGTPFTNDQFYYVCVIALVVAYLFVRNLILSPLGRSFQAVKESTDTASSLGFIPGRTRVLLFTLSGGLAGLAGGLYVQQLTFISPESGSLNSTLSLFIALFIGGSATLSGPLLGIAAITLVNEVLRGQGQLAQLVLGVVLLVTMFAIPKGIVGTWRASRWGLATLHRTPPGDRAARSTAEDPPTEANIVDLVEPVPRTDAGLSDSDDAPFSGPALEATGISKRFGGVTALEDARISVRPGQIHGLIGPNGAGKSTLVNCLSGFYKPDEGEVLLQGVALTGSPHKAARAGLCRVFQVPHTLDNQSVIDNVLLGLDSSRATRLVGSIFRSPQFRSEEARSREIAVGMLAVFGLDDVAELPASVLSHGQRRLLEVARAVGREPSILILDEPATGLTRSELAALSRVLRELRDKGMAILLIEHNMEFVMDLCNDITVLALGKVIGSGTPDEVRSSETVRSVYLGDGQALRKSAKPTAGVVQ